MAGYQDRRIGFVIGLLGALLILVNGLLILLGGVVFLALGRGLRAVGAIDQGLLHVVFAVLAGFFLLLGRARGEDRTLAAGAVLVVLVVVGWVLLGLTSGLLPLLGSVLILVAGVLYLVAGR